MSLERDVNSPEGRVKLCLVAHLELEVWNTSMHGLPRGVRHLDVYVI